MSYLPIFLFAIFLFTKASYCQSLDPHAGTATTFGSDASVNFLEKVEQENMIIATDRQTIQVQGVAFENSFYPFDGKVIFDQDRDSIELPLSLHYHLIIQLSSISGMSCNEEADYPICIVQTQELLDLPSILVVGVSDQITLKPEIYIQDRKLVNSTHTLITLNLKALTEEDQILLGQNMMGHFHVILNKTSEVDHTYQTLPPLLIADMDVGYIVAVFACSFFCVCLRALCRNSNNERTPVVVQQNLAANYVPPPQVQANLIRYNPSGVQNEPGMGQYRYVPLSEPAVPNAQQNQMNLSDEERARMRLASINNEYGTDYYARS